MKLEYINIGVFGQTKIIKIFIAVKVSKEAAIWGNISEQMVFEEKQTKH